MKAAADAQNLQYSNQQPVLDSSVILNIMRFLFGNKEKMMASEKMFEKMAQAIVEGRREMTAALAWESIAMGIAPLEAMDGFTKGIQIVGSRYERGEIFLPELDLLSDGTKTYFGTDGTGIRTVDPSP